MPGGEQAAASQLAGLLRPGRGSCFPIVVVVAAAGGAGGRCCSLALHVGRGFAAVANGEGASFICCFSSSVPLRRQPTPLLPGDAPVPRGGGQRRRKRSRQQPVREKSENEMGVWSEGSPQHLRARARAFKRDRESGGARRGG